MNEEQDRPARSFIAIDSYFTDEGLVLVSPDEVEAQRAYCEGLLKGYKIRLEGNKIILLAFGKKQSHEA